MTAAAALLESRERRKNEKCSRVWVTVGRHRVFVSPIAASGRSIKGEQIRRPPVHRAKIGPGGRALQATFPAQAQVAAWARGGGGGGARAVGK
jgi:hypothetical protein